MAHNEEEYYDSLPPPGPHRTHNPTKSCFVPGVKRLNDEIASIFGVISADQRFRHPLTVRFAPDTAPGVEADVAVSITRHRIKDNKYIEYTVVIHQKGYTVHALTKRYKQFEALNSALKDHNKLSYIPPMPTKRYFKTNKWDDEYHMERRFSLQQYLRIVIKLFAKSADIREFLELKEDILSYTDHRVLSSERHAGLPPLAGVPQGGSAQSSGKRSTSGERPPLKISADGTIVSGDSVSGTRPPEADTFVNGNSNEAANASTRPPLKVSTEMLNAARALGSGVPVADADSSSKDTDNASKQSKVIHAHATIITHSTSSSSIPVPTTREVSVDYDIEVLEAMTARLKQIALEDSLGKGSGLPINSRSMGVSASSKQKLYSEIDFIDRVDGLSSSPGVRASFGTSPHSISRMKNKEMMVLSQMNESIGETETQPSPRRDRDRDRDRDSDVNGVERRSTLASDDAADYRFYSSISNHDAPSDAPNAALSSLSINTATNAASSATMTTFGATNGNQNYSCDVLPTRLGIISSSSDKSSPPITPLANSGSNNTDGNSSSDHESLASDREEDGDHRKGVMGDDLVLE